MEDAAIHARLQAKDAALRNLTKKYLSFAHAIEHSSVEECEALHASLQFDIAQYEFAVSKADAMIDTNVRQVAEYDLMQQNVEAEMCADPPLFFFVPSVAALVPPLRCSSSLPLAPR